MPRSPSSGPVVCLCGLNAPGLPSRVPSDLGKSFGSLSLRPGLTAWLRFLDRTASLRFPALSTRVDRPLSGSIDMLSSCVLDSTRKCPRRTNRGHFHFLGAAFKTARTRERGCTEVRSVQPPGDHRSASSRFHTERLNDHPSGTWSPTTVRPPGRVQEVCPHSGSQGEAHDVQDAQMTPESDQDGLRTRRPRACGTCGCGSPCLLYTSDAADE